MTTVYVLFSVSLNGDGYPEWRFVAVARDLPPLQGIVAHQIKEHRGQIRSFCPSRMTELNNYTIIDRTENVHADIEHVFPDVLGFVIQADILL